MHRGVPPPHAVGDFAFGEDALQESVPYRSMVLTMRGISVRSTPRPMMFGMIRRTDETTA
jgi:hypothetical protein